MYCPNCGKSNPNEQRYCRSCGLSLQAISQTLDHELSAGGTATEIIRREQKGWPNPLLYGLLMLTLGIIIVIIGQRLLGEKSIADIGILIALLGIGLLGFKGVLLTLSQFGLPTQPTALSDAEAQTKLPAASQFGAVPSVAEQTTRHFEAVYSERKAE